MRGEGSVSNTFGEIRNTFGVFEISFGVLQFSAGLLKGKSAVQTGGECLLLDTAEATLDVALNITSDYVAFHEAWLREGKAVDHLITQRIGVLRVEPVVRRDEHKIEHTILVLLQLVVANNDGRMGLECPVGKEETNLYDVSLVVFHR